MTTFIQTQRDRATERERRKGRRKNGGERKEGRRKGGRGRKGSGREGGRESTWKEERDQEYKGHERE